MTKAPISMRLKIWLTLLWVTFPLLWYRANQRTVPGYATDSLVFLLGMIAAYGMVVGVWIVHNIRIWRKKGPRRNLRAVHFVATHDSLKRPILKTVSLMHGKNIDVAVVGDRKIFSYGSEPPHPPRLKAS